MTVNGSSKNIGGTITYNGITFAGPRVRWSMRMKPEYSDDGRTTLANQYTLTVRYLASDDGSGYRSHMTGTQATDIVNSRTLLQQARAKLTKNGQRLTIVGMGFDLDLNKGSAYTDPFDTRWGPHCELSITPVGDGVLWQLDWVCVFTLPECYSAGSGDAMHGTPSYIISPLVQGDLESLVFNVSYSIDRGGLTTRTISGKLTAAINRASTTNQGATNVLVHTADELWDSVAPVVPPNFQRVSQDRSLSDDKRSLVFSIVDQELESTNEYPDGVIDMAVDHSVNITGTILPASNVPINCSFSGFIEVYKGYPLGTAFDKIILIMQQRLDHAKSVFVANDDTVPVGKAPVYITSVNITESLYGKRRVSFAVTYVINTANQNSLYLDILDRSGLFLDVNVAGVSNTDWQASLQNTAWDNRGLSQLAFDPTQDKIIGPCEGVGGTVTDESTAPIPSYLGGGSLVTGCPPEGYDYLWWDSQLVTKSDHRSRSHTPLQSAGSTTSLGQVSDIYGTNAVATYRQTSDSNLETINSYESASTMITICLKGQAHRVGKAPEIPKVNLDQFHSDVAVSGVLAPTGTDRIKNRRMGKLGTCPVYHTTWYICYTYTARTSTDLQTILQKIEQSLVLTDSDDDGKKVGGTVQGL